MGLLLGVGEEVPSKGAVQRKLHRAEMARERSLTVVNGGKVSFQSLLGGKRLFAHRTFMYIFVGVKQHVSCQRKLLHELFVA